MCEIHEIFGFALDGGMAKFVRIPKRCRVHKVPEGISLEDCAIIEPLACAIHCVNRANIQLDDVVVIAGAGLILLVSWTYYVSGKDFVVTLATNTVA